MELIPPVAAPDTTDDKAVVSSLIASHQEKLHF